MENPTKGIEYLIEAARDIVSPTMTEEQKKVFLRLFEEFSKPSRYEKWVEEKRKELESILNKYQDKEHVSKPR